ncbi:MAG: SRPBCC family protein [Bacteroidia bacterium]|nr:SRPBCC family protein [Bacteroidia bacterium]
MSVSNSNKFAIAEMLIRKPINDVFTAFIDPAITTKFWFTKSTGSLIQGKTIKWTWEMYDVSIDIKVTDILPHSKIQFTWGNANQNSNVEITFTQLDETKTFVSIKNSGFTGTEDEIVSSIRDATGGFSWVLSGLKAYLEYDIQLNLIADRYPKAIRDH